MPYIAARPDAELVLVSSRGAANDTIDDDVIAALSSLPDARVRRRQAQRRPVASEAARVLVSVVTMSSVVVSYMLYVLFASPY